MSEIKAGKLQAGISVTPSHNFLLDASAANGTMTLKRADGSVILTVDATGLVDIAGSGKIFGRDNLLGTVSQSAGIPTGAAIEWGRNANGDYLKLADGTIICTNVTAGSSTGDLTWTFPAAMAAAPIYQAASSASASTTAGYTGNAHSATSTSFQWALWASSNTRVTVAARLIAIGRWY